jgi:hypothetical protein
VCAEKSGEDGGGEAGVMVDHHLVHPVRIEGATVRSAEGLGDEDERHTRPVRAAHRSHDVFRTDVLVVEFELTFRGEFVLAEHAARVEHHHQRVGVEACSADLPLTPPVPH